MIRTQLLPSVLTLGTVCLIGTASVAAANDTHAAFAAGGLQFTKTDEIRMEREDLSIGHDRIRVSYRYRNLTDHDVRMEVAFPLPDVNVWEMSETPHQFHRSAQSGDIFNFHLWIDGRAATPQFDVHAIELATGHDITDLLRHYRIPLTDSAPDGDNDLIDKLTHLDAAAAKVLSEAGAFYRDDDPRHPHWIVKAAYHWTETFPAHREITVRHEYQPVLGGSLANGVDLAKNISENDQPYNYPRRYCTGPEDAAATAKLPGYGDGNNPPVKTEWVEYVLKTGANWAGPIGRFHLEIDQGDADLMALCRIPGLDQQRRGRSVVADATDFTPASDIAVLYVFGNCSRRPCRAK
jgi:hypothetical protein